MKKRFFLTGFPRCRSAWFANLLTHGSTFCHHDIFSYVATMDELKTRMNLDYEVIGISDPALVFFWEEILETYPDAPWIVIERPFQETLESCQKSFSEFQEADLHVIKARLEALKVRLKPKIFDFHKLDLRAVKEISEMCHTSINPERMDLLMDMQVQIEPKYLLTKIQELKKYPTQLMKDAA